MANALTNEEVWLAGVLEGDGSFELSKSGSGTYIPTIRLGMLDKDVVERFTETFNSNIVSYLTPKRDKTMYRSRISRRDVVQPFLLKIYPLMGERRKDQIAKMLNWYLQHPIQRRLKASGGV